MHLAWAAVLALVAGACGASGADSADDGRSITVFAAASLTDVFEEIGTAFEEANPQIDVQFSFGGSSALVEQIRAGAPADVVATADETSMEILAEADLVAGPAVFARNSLALVVEEGNPLGIASLADAAAPGVAVIVCAEEVPCGRLAGELFADAGLEPDLRSFEASVRGVVSKVQLGEGDAGIVYATDAAAAADHLDVVPIEEDIGTRYPIAAVEDGATAGQDFVDFVLSAEGQRLLREAGFGGRG